MHIDGFGVGIGLGNGHISYFFKMVFVLVTADDERNFGQGGGQFFVVFNRQVGEGEHYIAFGFQLGKVAFGSIEVLAVFRPGLAAGVDEYTEHAEVECSAVSIF